MEKNFKKILKLSFIYILCILTVFISNNYGRLNIESLGDFKNKISGSVFRKESQNLKKASTDNSEIMLVPGGDAIGVKLYSDGILVVGFSDVESRWGRKSSPALSSGIQLGDIILSINDVKIINSKHLSDVVSKNGNSQLNMTINRKGEIFNIKITPEKLDKSGGYKLGLWVRDSAAGIGTMTFYDLKKGKFGALGHPINDADTGVTLKVREGTVYSAKIIAIEEGLRGNPGELKGMYYEDRVIGKIEKNTSQGIYGLLKEDIEGRTALPIGRKNEVKEGPAQILTTLNDDRVCAYDIMIEKTFSQSKASSKSMIIKITDEELLQKTGGIVQGMSGSPIIQDGKIIGAVTHVFVNKPDMGYGIYIEWMLNELGYDI